VARRYGPVAAYVDLLQREIELIGGFLPRPSVNEIHWGGGNFFAKGRIREDGRMVHDMYLVEVKAPNESKAAWDYYKVLRRIPAEEAAQPLSESKCSLVKQ
jgi:hypothetical protein